VTDLDDPDCDEIPAPMNAAVPTSVLASSTSSVHPAAIYNTTLDAEVAVEIPTGRLSSTLPSS
jgi:hypothetical protein